MYIQSDTVEWDSEKDQRNRAKHGVAFVDAVAVLEDDLALTILDSISGSEDRFVSIGSDVFGRVLVVVYTWRGSRARLISARRATRRELHHYEED